MSSTKIILGQIEISPLIQAFSRFEEARIAIQDDLDRDGTIQRFEYTFELAWKTLKRILDFKGVTAHNPRDAFRLAAREGYLDDPKVWFDFLEKRNLATHTYKEEIANQIAAVFDKFSTEVTKLLARISNL